MKTIANFLRKFMLLKSDHQAVWALVYGMMCAITTIPIGLYIIVSLLNYTRLDQEELKGLHIGIKLVVGMWGALFLFYIVIGVIGKMLGDPEEINWWFYGVITVVVAPIFFNIFSFSTSVARRGWP